MTHHMMSGAQGHEMSAEMRACIEMCQTCHATCLETVMHCLSMGGDHAAPDHVALMLDCVDICATSANFMLRGSARHALTCGVCAQVCAACAEDCERFDDDFMKACAAVCRRCAASCREMAAAG